MRRRFIPLFWKFSIGIILVVIFFSSFTLPFIWFSISKSLERELSNRIIFISKSIAQKSISHILFNEISELNKLVDETCKIDDNIAYIFILDTKNNIIAHSFSDGFPEELLNANSVNNDSLNIVRINTKVDKNKYILDIAAPIMGCDAGVVRVGLYENKIQADVDFIYKSLLVIIFLFFVISLFIAFLYSYLITKPLKFISIIAQDINLESLQNCFESKIVLENSFSFKLRRLFFANDEIDTLYNKFINMIERLDKTHNDLKMTNKSMLNSEKMASIGILASGIAHEINNPIIGLQNCVKRISDNSIDNEQKERYIDMMNESIDRIEKVVQGLLNYSRKQEFKLLTITIKSALENAIQLASFHLERNNISIINNIPYNIPFIKGSKNHLEQVFLNLIINSIDAIAEKKKQHITYCGEIKFECISNESELILKVIDNGIGIFEENLSNIFDPFYTTKEIGHGTGLGLSISYNIIHQHNGEIKIESKYNKGTTVKLIFPVEKHT